MKLNLIQIYDPGLALRHRIYTPGLRLFGVRTQDSGDGASNPRQRAERSPHLRSSTCARPTRRPLGVNLSGRISFIKDLPVFVWVFLKGEAPGILMVTADCEVAGG